MPKLKRRTRYAKVLRPEGTPYAEGFENYFIANNEHGQIMSMIIGRAIEQAYQWFYEEFERWPIKERTVVEVTCDTFGVKATVFEIPEGEI